jgi:hypothetical protein
MADCPIGERFKGEVWNCPTYSLVFATVDSRYVVTSNPIAASA